MNALKQLTRRIRVNLIYDPAKSFLKKQESATDMISEFTMADVKTL